MSAFPQTIHFMGLNTPVGIEASVRNLPVIGEIPPEIEGAFFRAPDPAPPPKFAARTSNSVRSPRRATCRASARPTRAGPIAPPGTPASIRRAVRHCLAAPSA